MPDAPPLPPSTAIDSSSPAVILYTSGTTADPKGVVLSHSNILSNIHQFQSHLNILPEEVVLGVLPFFHSFGFTVTLWTVLCLGRKVVYHFDPLAARAVGNLCREHRVTLMIGTPTFVRTYLLRCEPEQFASVDRLVLGAEKLKPELARDILEKMKAEIGTPSGSSPPGSSWPPCVRRP